MKVVGRGILVGLAVAMVAGPALAQQPAAAPARIAFVDARALLQSMPGYSAAESTFTKELETGRAEIQRLQRQLDSAVADFEQQQQMLSATNRAARRKELETRGQSLQQRNQELQARLGQRERELLTPMQDRLTAVIEGIRAENNYIMVIDLGAQGLGIVTYDKSLDISQRVAQRLKTSN